MTNAQQWLDSNYPQENRKNTTKLEINSKNLEGELDLSEFTNLNEIVIASQKQRNWEGFYQWLNDNVVDINERGSGKGNIKLNKRSKYSKLSSDYNCVGFLMNGLEFYLGKTPIDYTGSNFQSQHKEPLLPYDDNKNFFQLANGQGNSFKCAYTFSLPSSQNALDDFEKLLKDWKNSTASTTNKIKASIKLGHSQKIADLEKSISKLNLEVEEVSSELLEIKKQELEQLLSETKNKLDRGSWGYLDILLLCPDKSLISNKAKENLTDKLNNNDLQKLLLLKHQVNHLEKRISEVQQVAQIEILPPSYN